MFRILINVSYDGSPFFGWQRQTKFSPTIQELLEDRLSKIFNKKIRVIGSGRTDRGAHALSQWAHADVPKDPSSLNLTYRLNRLTPDELRINAVYLAPNNFHAQRSALKKKYIYKVYNSPYADPLRLHYYHHVKKPLDINLLNKLATYVVGKHDFSSFQSSGTDVESPIRTIFKAYWVQKGEVFTFHVIGDGFLKQMVRNLVGTMLWCSRHGQPEETFLKILQSQDRRKAKEPAPSHGLFLKWVKYPPELDNKCRKL